MGKRRDMREWDSSDNLIRLLIDHSCIQSLSLTWYTVTPVTELNLLPSLTEQSKMKAIEQWFPKIFIDLSHGLEPRFDLCKPQYPVFLFFFFSNNTPQYFHISLQHFLDLIGGRTEKLRAPPH